jgi:hypothetical protein
MKPSGLNSIEYVLQGFGFAFKVAGYIMLAAIAIPAMWILWSWHTMAYQAKTIQALNAAPVTHLTLDFNQLGADPQLAKVLPWAPGVTVATEHDLRDPVIYLDKYRIWNGAVMDDPWYLHGLFKLAPGKAWDSGTGPDYAFGKCSVHYRAYAGACRAVMAMHSLIGPGSGKGQLPMVTLDLQRFNDKTWAANPELTWGGRNNPDWQERMGWWPGTHAGNGSSAPPEDIDFYITGLHVTGQDAGMGRPRFTPLDFIVWHLPSTTSDQDRALKVLTDLATDAYWEPLLPVAVRADGFRELADIREDLAKDYRFARKYGFIVFSGEKFGRSPTIMQQ